LSSLETLPMKGIYTLIILVNTKSRLKVGKLGYFNFKKGYYAYTGSALGDGAVSLKRRVVRHFKKEKPKNWHIDFLLANKNVKVIAVVAAESSANKECQINNLIKNIQGAKVPIVGFGASDCIQNCKSHLIYFGEENVKEKIVDAYTRLFGQIVF
jgi:Uri superfamily endonuclease